jgi:probable HAF family extracellular repeat protein
MTLMKIKVSIFSLVLAVSTSAVLVSAQEQSSQTRHRQYRVVDIGTFGGPTSQTNGGSKVINNAGTVVGIADTATPCPYFPGFVSPAFKWQDGVLANIGLLPGACFSLPNAISENGIIVGSSDNGKIDPATGFPELHADVRKNGRLLDLGTFGGTFSLSGDVNTRGVVVGAAENTDADPFNFGGLIGLPSPTAWIAFRWHDGKITNLGTLGGPDSFAFFVNKYDEISGISFTNSNVNPTTGLPTLAPFFWKNGRMRNIGSLGGVFGVMNYLNNRSEVVGYSDLEGDLVTHAYLWKQAKGMKDLGVLGGTFSMANWINESDETVGGSTTSNNEAFHAVRWRHGVIEDLGTVGGNSCSNAFQINASGEIAGQSFNCDGTGDAHATLWEPSGRGIDLNVFLPPDSNLLLAESHFVNDQGEIVVVGLLPNGDQHIVVFVPCGESKSDDCRDTNEGRTAAPEKQANFGTVQTRLTPESLAAIRSRLTHKYRGLPASAQK